MPQALDGVRSGGCCRACAAAIIRGKSRMSSTLTYGSVRGVPGDRHPYRDPIFARTHFCHGLIGRAWRLAESRAPMQTTLLGGLLQISG